MKDFLDKVLNKTNKTILPTGIGLALYKLINKNKEAFTCPICNYYGPFANMHCSAGKRKHAICPKCNCCERERLQYLVIEKLAKNNNFTQMSILHFAPEPFFKKYFQNSFKEYTSADLNMEDVDYQVDLTDLPFKDKSYDFVFASHVLEHIKDDGQALSEIFRILRPNGIAVLPVPIVAHKTVEYPEANPYEAGHIRAPGLDYFERYSLYFSKVKTYSSHDLSGQYQVYVYEDRTGWPNKKIPLRPAIKGDKHPDFVPICFV